MLVCRRPLDWGILPLPIRTELRHAAVRSERIRERAQCLSVRTLSCTHYLLQRVAPSVCPSRLAAAPYTDTAIPFKACPSLPPYSRCLPYFLSCGTVPTITHLRPFIVALYRIMCPLSICSCKGIKKEQIHNISALVSYLFGISSGLTFKK